MVTIKDFNECFIDWQKSPNGLRFGQAFCNKFNITNQSLFYETNVAKAIDLILNRYLIKE